MPSTAGAQGAAVDRGVIPIYGRSGNLRPFSLPVACLVALASAAAWNYIMHMVAIKPIAIADPDHVALASPWPQLSLAWPLVRGCFAAFFMPFPYLILSSALCPEPRRWSASFAVCLLSGTATAVQRYRVTPQVVSYFEGIQEGIQENYLRVSALQLSNAYMTARLAVGAAWPHRFWTAMRMSHALNSVICSAFVIYAFATGGPLFLFDPKLDVFGSAAMICGQLTAAVAFTPKIRGLISRFFGRVPKLIRQTKACSRWWVDPSANVHSCGGV